MRRAFGGYLIGSAVLSLLLQLLVVNRPNAWPADEYSFPHPGEPGTLILSAIVGAIGWWLAHGGHPAASQPQQGIPPSIGRRFLMIVAYGLTLYVLLTIVVGAVQRGCAQLNTCSRWQQYFVAMAALLLFLGEAAVLVLGWRGRLPGARQRQPNPSTSGDPTRAGAA